MKNIIKKYTPHVFEIIGVIKGFSQKFLNDYNESKQDEEYQVSNPQNYSCVFEGNEKLETAKRRSLTVKKKTQKDVDEFLKTFDFNYLIDLVQIKKISIQNISLNQWKEYSIKIETNCFNNKEQQLSVIMDSLYILIIQYCKGQFILSNIGSEFNNHFKEIRESIMLLICKYSERSQKQVLLNLKQQIIEIVNCQDKNENLLALCEQLKQTNQIIKAKEMIENFFQVNQELLIQLIEGLYGFQVSEVILDLYQDQINQIYYSEMRKCLFHLYQFQEDNYTNLSNHLQFDFGQYLEDSSYFDGYGIQDKQINSNLQQILYLINWKKKEAVEVQKLVIYLQQFNGGTSQQLPNEIFQTQIFESFNSIRQQQQDVLQQSIQWYNKNVDIQMNKIVILQLYLFFIGLKVSKDKILTLNQYTPMSRIILMKILRHLNNGQHNYNNVLVLKILEHITGQIYSQLLQKQSITILHKQVQIQADKSFYEKNKFLALLYKSNKANYQKIGFKTRLNQIQELQHSDLQEQLQQYKVPGHEPPKYFFFELISNPTKVSNVITLCISGFISKTEDKYNQWKEMIQEDGSTVIALHYSCATLKELGLKILAKCGREALKIIGSQFFGPIANIANIVKFTSLKTIIELYHKNPFTEALEEAKIVGKYLGQLIAKQKIFGDCQINIVCHSLGSIVLNECIQELDKFYQYNKEQYINSIMILGGVVDVRKLQKRRWHSVGGPIFNIYSQEDGVLNYLLGLIKVFTNPCGNQRVYIGYKEVINYDFSEFLKGMAGHFYYKGQLRTILQLTDFDNDNKFILNQEI